MSSTLEQDYEEFTFSTENQLDETNVEEKFHNLNNNSPKPFEELEHCEICNEKFQTKKDLQTHVFIHLGKPCVVLERIPSLKKTRKEPKSDQYWLETEHKGNLKFKLKIKQSPSVDSLKLKLKKSPISEGFTVVSNNFDSIEDQFKVDSELADIHDNDSEEEETAEQSFENVMISQENNYEDENFESELDHNPLESLEKPSMDNNEQDSGVGSDSVNPLEKEDQNVDDMQADNISNFDQTELNEVENEYNEAEENETEENEAEENVAEENAGENAEDLEETEALEATCRETIENLKRLGEDSSSRSPDLLHASGMPSEEDDKYENGTEPDQEEDTEKNQGSDPKKGQNQEPEPEQEAELDEVDGERGEENEEQEKEKGEEEDGSAQSTIEGLQRNSEISLVPKSALMPHPSSRKSSSEAETEILPLRGSGSSISWNRITELPENQKNKDSHENIEKDNSESERANSLLQNFLLERQRNRNEPNSAPVLETEYVSLEKLAETVNTCRVCNEKFKDIAHLDAHRAKAGHYQCNIPDCSALVFTTPLELSVHKAQIHGAPVSPNLSNMSPHQLSQNSPHSHHSNSPHLNRASPHMNTHSPHSPSLSLPTRGSPITSPHTNSPTYQPPPAYPGINIDQLPAPVQQLAQQVQRMPLPQTQIPPSMPPGANTMIPGPSYYPPPGRPMYRAQAPPMHYPPHLAHMYQGYGQNPYQQMGMPPGLQQQIPRGRCPIMMPGQRGPRMAQQMPQQMPQQLQQQMTQGPMPGPPVSRVRMKRPLVPGQPGHAMQQNLNAVKQRRIDVPIADSNEDTDCQFIAQQKRNDGLPVIQNVQGGASVVQSNRSDSTIHLTDSITLSVRQPAQVNAMVQNAKKPDASAVANVLAARGITVTPASRKPSSETSQVQNQQTQQQTPQQKQISTLNLNSAISIIPTSQKKQQEQQQQGQFAVPQNKNKQAATSDVERPPRPPTVDLTQDMPLTPVIRRGRPPRMLQSLTCQVCDKRFQSQEMLSQHMATHRTTNKLLHKCNLCPAQYPNSSALMTHKKTYHKEVDAPLQQNGNIELALPVVDLKSPNILSRLSNLGIQSYIPLSQLSAQTGGYFGLPIVTIDGPRNPNSSNLAALGATSILSLGPLKHLTNR